MRTVKYFLWCFIYLTHTTILLMGMKGLLGREAKIAYRYLAKKLKMGVVKLTLLSFIIGTIIYMISGGWLLFIVLKIFKFF